jgi:hypothetical protein
MTIVGHCSKCGAPIYMYDSWTSTVPQRETYSCNCLTGHALNCTYTTGAYRVVDGELFLLVDGYPPGIVA